MRGVARSDAPQADTVRTMDSRVTTLLASIEQGLSTGTSTTALLQQCILLGGKSGSKQLREWASRELNGYNGKTDKVPEYRTINAVIRVDAVVGRTQITGQPIGSQSLPDFVQEAGLSEELPLTQGIGEIEAAASREDNSVKYSLPGADIIGRAIDQQSGQAFQQTYSIYWDVSTTTMRGVVEKIRTALAEFLAELLDQLPAPDSSPTKEAVDRAITVVLSGGQPVVNLNSGSNATSLTTTRNDTNMGDKFENISNSTIVNRSSLINALNRLDSQGDDEAVASLRELEQVVSESNNSNAADCLDSFTEELNREEPRKSVLQAMWNGILTALPYVANIAAITTGIGHLVGA